MNIEEFAARFDGVKKNRSGGYSCKCPAHKDKSPSLCFKQADDGKILMTCFAGCAPADVLAAVGLQMSDLFNDYRTDANGLKRRDVNAWKFGQLRANKNLRNDVEILRIMRKSASNPSAADLAAYDAALVRVINALDAVL